MSEPQIDERQDAHKKHASCKHSASHSKKDRKIVIIGDSQAKGCAAEINQVIGNSSEVVGYVKLGSRLDNIRNIVNKEIQELTKEDVVILWGGTNDIARNESNEGLTHLTNFVEQIKNTNIMLMSAPHRHDLADMSCVNVEVAKFNRKLTKMMKVHDHVNVINMVNLRECYTRHGMHLNRVGKEQMAHKIIHQIKNLFSVNNTPLIPLTWKEEDPVDLKTSTTNQNSRIMSRLPSRNRKHPTSRGDDFLWEFPIKM